MVGGEGAIKGRSSRPRQVNHPLNIDRIVDRLPHPLVGGKAMLNVEQKRHAQIARLSQLFPSGSLHRIRLLLRQIHHQVSFARQQCRQPLGSVGFATPNKAGMGGSPPSATVGKWLQYDLVFPVCHQLVGAAAHQPVGQIGQGVLRHNGNGNKQVEQVGHGSRCGDANGRFSRHRHLRIPQIAGPHPVRAKLAPHAGVAGTT